MLSAALLPQEREDERIESAAQPHRLQDGKRAPERMSATERQQQRECRVPGKSGPQANEARPTPRGLKGLGRPLGDLLIHAQRNHETTSPMLAEKIATTVIQP